MAFYELRYWKNFEQPDGRVIRLEIHGKGIEGVSLTAYEIGPVMQSFALDIQGQSGDIDTPIVKTSLNMTFVDAPDHPMSFLQKCGDWEEFYTNDSTMWKVLVRTKSPGSSTFATIWGGYITPDSFSEQLRYRGSVSIVARDNIGHMQDFPFDAEGDANGMISLRELVETAWAKIESPMTLYWPALRWLQCNGVYAFDTRMNVSAFKDMNWYEAVEKALYSYGAVMRYIGENQVLVCSLRYMPQQGRSSMDQVTHIEPTFVAHAQRELTPAAKRIEESVSYETGDGWQVPLAKGITFLGGEDDVTFISKNVFGETTRTSIPVNPIDRISGEGWSNDTSASLFFNPKMYTIRDAALKEDAERMIFLACNTDGSHSATFRKTIFCKDMQIRFQFGRIVERDDLGGVQYCFGFASGTQDNGVGSIHVKKVQCSVAVEQYGITQYWTGSDWQTSACTLDIAPDEEGFGIDIKFKNITGHASVMITFENIIIDLMYDYSKGYGLYVPISSMSFGVLQNTALCSKNTVNTNYNEKNNVIITRSPEIAPAMDEVPFPNAIKNGIFYYDGEVILPAKAWNWDGGTPQQMAVYNHLQLLCYHSKPNNLITGDIVNASMVKMAVIYTWGGKEHLLISGRYDFLNNRIEGAVLREFVRYDDMWGDVSGTSLPDTEENSTTNQEGGGSSSSGSTYDNTTNVVIGGEGGGSVTIDPFLSDTSTNPVESKAIKAYIDSADNEIKERIAALEEGSDVDHPVFEFTFDTTTNKATAEMVSALAEAISENKLILCNGRTYKFILEDGGMYGLVSDAYMDITDGKLKTSILAVTASTYDVQLMEEEVPTGTEITEATVAGWGFTKNAGTITGIKMNGATKGTSGVVDLGTVLTEHQKLKTINNQSIVGEGNINIQGGGGATERVEMTAESAAIEPNKFYVWPMMDSLDVSLGAEQGGVMNKYFFQFRNPKAGVTMLTLPDTITWSEDTELDENGMPVMEAAAFYRIEIIEGLASLKKWKLVYINFADAEVERALMSKGIGDGIGITKRDAKSVTSIGAIFVNNEVVESFEEFEFFTGITAITGSPWEDGGFRGCANLKKIKLPKSLQTIFAGAIPGQYSSTGAFKDCISLEEITIPTGVDTIPTSAFYNCKSLVAVHFDGTVKAFDQYAFAECINLVIEIPSSVEHIDERAFLNVPMKGIVVDCPNLKYLSGRYVFTRSKIRGVESLGNITELRFQSDPPGYYGNYPTFYGCADMEFINLPDTLTHIGRNMFQGCSALRSVTIPHGVGELFTGTFAGCYNLEWMKVEAVTPPALYTLDCIDMGSDYPIYVPNASVEAYKGATNWNSYAHRIRGLQDFILGIVTPQSIRCSSSILTAENAVGEKVWSIVGGSEFATITEDGILTILPNASDAEVTIRCTDNNGNIAEKMINVTYNAPLMYLPFDEDFVDAMGNASLLNAVECSIDESKGVIGASMNRPYTAGGLSYQPSFNASFADKSFSVDVWVYLPSNAPNTYLGIAGKRTNASLGASWSFGIKDRKVNIGLSANGGGFTNDFYTDAVIPLEKWTRVTMVRDYGRGEYRVYVDTKLVATFGANYALYNGSDGLAVGNYHTDPSNDYFYGNLDEFRIYEGCIFD